jgi:hypothetical protein
MPPPLAALGADTIPAASQVGFAAPILCIAQLLPPAALETFSRVLTRVRLVIMGATPCLSGREGELSDLITDKRHGPGGDSKN